MMQDLFADQVDIEPRAESLSDGAVVLRAQALAQADRLMIHVNEVAQAAPFRHLVTPGGFTMSVAMTNCGQLGWVSDHKGYRYEHSDPLSGLPWPELPQVFLDVATKAALQAGYTEFHPSACLINRYEVGAKMSLHQDKDEGHSDQPIVSISLGLPAVFLWGGLQRGDPTQKVGLNHGDVVVWGGASRLRFHGVLPLKAGIHPQLGAQRVNITFRYVRE